MLWFVFFAGVIVGALFGAAFGMVANEGLIKRQLELTGAVTIWGSTYLVTGIECRAPAVGSPAWPRPEGTNVDRADPIVHDDFEFPG